MRLRPPAVHACKHIYAGDLHPPVHPSAWDQHLSRGRLLLRCSHPKWWTKSIIKFFFFLLLLIILTIYCFPAFRTAPSNSPLPSRRPRNTQATPTSITNEEVAVVGDRLPRLCLCLCLCVFGGGAALQTLIKSFIPQRCCQVRLCSRGMSRLIGSLCCGPCARSPPLLPPRPPESARASEVLTLRSPRHRTTGEGAWTVTQNGQMFSTKLTFYKHKTLLPLPQAMGNGRPEQWASLLITI